MKLTVLFLVVLALGAPCLAAPSAVDPAEPVARNSYANNWKKWVPTYRKPHPTPYFRPVWCEVDATREPGNSVRRSEHYFKAINPSVRNNYPKNWKKWIPKRPQPLPSIPYWRPVWREVDTDRN